MLACTAIKSGGPGWPRTAANRTQIRATPTVRLWADGSELLHTLAAVLRDVHVALRIDCDTVRLIELAGIVALAAEARQDLAGAALDHFDAGVVLIDDEHQPLNCIARERNRHRRAAAGLQFPVASRRDRSPRNLDVADKLPAL